MVLGKLPVPGRPTMWSIVGQGPIAPVWQHTFVSPSAFSRRAVVSYWRKYVHEVLVNRLGGLSLPRKSVVRLTDRPDMTLGVYCGRKTTMQQGPIALAVGAGGVVWTYSHLSFLSSFSLSLENGSIWTEILSQWAVKPKTTNQCNDFRDIIICEC